ncbi:MAG: GTP 3',8-cyclase MoaA [Streptomyces sp.]|uniref:GTP 3',8-cyclase MoaA n=1 Tax=Streptomyces sp. TaxID=1931 RepID=UPI0025EAC80A|nr:GTP 3',8-cyclase MoaA [Streptomyces sp.]MBW8792176.1 GTP 3',8-cyclase MoaA [Streptomyces sp.]
MLTDGFGRVHRDLRVSLTDRCQLRCTYCMPAEGLPWAQDVLTADEIARVVRVAVREGITEVRLTGGEPLLRRDIVDIVAAIDVPDLSLTTNGMGLARLADELKAAGLHRVNVSVDTLRPDRFRMLTRRGGHEAVLDGLYAARAAGLTPVKVNTVLMRGVNDDEILELVAWARAEELQLRFIEHMPLGPEGSWERSDMVTAEEVLEVLGSAYAVTPLDGRESAPAELWQLDGSGPPVGVIASVTRPFCGDCDRLRLTADGHLRSCLFARDEDDLRPLLRGGGSDDALAEFLHATLARKGAGHGIGLPGFQQPERTMSEIGG